MKCPNCGAQFDDTSRFCGICGSALEAEKRGTHRVPILIMLALSIIGIWVFIATSGAAVPQQTEPEYPWFRIYQGQLQFHADSYTGGTELAVPETVDGQTVTAIGEACFYDCAGMTEVILPDTITYIGMSAFEDCDSLRGIDLPDGVTDIDSAAFSGCDSLEAIHIPASVTFIGWDVFDDCGNLRYIFYDGTLEQWQSVFDYELNADTAVCCTDGTFWQEE